MRIISFLLAIFAFFSNLFNFVPKYTGDYGDDPVVDPEIVEDEKEYLAINGSKATILNKGVAIGLDISDDNLFITYLGTPDGESVVTNTCSFALPEAIQVYKKSLFTYKWSDTSVTWKYSSVERYDGKEHGKTTIGVVYTFTCSSPALSLSVLCKTATGYSGPFEFVTAITNSTGSDIRLKPGNFGSATISASNTEDKLFYVAKESGQAEGYTNSDNTCYSGTGIYQKLASVGSSVSAWATTYQDWNSNGYYPLIFLQKQSEGAYVGLEWSSGQVTADCKSGSVAFDVNMDYSQSFVTALADGDLFTFPTTYVGYYTGSLDAGTNAFKKWFFNCKSPEKLRDDENEPFTQMDMQQGLNSYGCEAIKWDYGWWSDKASGDWQSYEGSWEVRNSAYLGVLASSGCSTLADFGAACQKNGFSLTAYVLLHDTLDGGSTTTAYGEFNSVTHPSWFSNRKIATGMGQSADLGNTECVAYLQTALTSFFKNNNVTTWRSDFEPICSSSDKENRHLANGSDVQYWCTVGFGEVVDYIYDNVEGFRYESCSSGGSMKDLFTATKAVVINCDDDANYMSMRTTFYDSSYILHPTQLQMPCNIDNYNPDKSTFYPACEQGDMTSAEYKSVCLNMGFRSQMLGVPMFSSWTATVLGSYYTKYTAMYKEKIRPLIRNGDLYHILPRPDGVNWDGVAYVDDDASEIKGVAFLFKPSTTEGDTKTIKFEGLTESRKYTVTFEDNTAANTVMTGKQLMENGLSVTIETAVGSEIVWLS